MIVLRNKDNPLEQQPVAEEHAKAAAASSRRVIDVLFYFAEHQPIASVKEIAEALRLPVPTVHRYVAMLRQQGILARSGRGRSCHGGGGIAWPRRARGECAHTRRRAVHARACRGHR